MAKQVTNQLDLIQALLHEKFLEKDTNSEILAEKNLMSRKIITHNGLDYLLYKYDPDKSNIFPYFAETSGLCKICDYIMFVTEGKYLFMLLIELKLGTESATSQLVASECFADYLIASAKRIGLSITEHIHVKKIRISEERAKRRNRQTKPGVLKHDQNNIINYDHSIAFRIKEVLEVN